MSNGKYDAVIIGAGLTGLTLAFYLKKAGLKIKVLEKDDRVGGVIKTHYENDFIYETGPNSGVLSTPEAAELFEDLKNCELEFANENSKARWIWKSGKWEPLPSGIVDAVKTPLFKFMDKLHVMGEPFIKKGDDPDESVADLVKRRLGESFLHYAVDPFISGIYAGDPEKLITKYALPKLYNLEQNYGSFIKGSIKKKGEEKSERDKKANRKVFSVKNGLQNMVNSLENAIGADNISLSVNDIKVRKIKEIFEINYSKQTAKTVYSDKVITTSGGYSLKNMFPDISDELINPIVNLKYAKVAQAILGFKHWKGIDLRSFGGLVPEQEHRKILGVLFLSSIFSNRAPEKGALLSVFHGGSRRPEIVELNDDEIIYLVKTELKEMMQLDSIEPDLLKVVRYEHAIPQYEITSKERYLAIEKLQNRFKGLILAGNIRDGIGMSDRIAQARQIADELIKNSKNE
jgi:oxygen-dependent protoporphyrinogen oxidase